MVNVGEFVRVKQTGEKGRLMAIYPAHDGTTLLIKTPTGDLHIDMPVGALRTDYLELLPMRPKA